MTDGSYFLREKNALKQQMIDCLVPRPQRLRWTEKQWKVPKHLKILLASSPREVRPIARRLVNAWQEQGVEVTLTGFARKEGCRYQADIVLLLAPERKRKAQSYRLAIEEGGITITGSDLAGLFYGVLTMCQWIDGWGWNRSDWGEEWPTAILSDWPDFPVRGVMLDVSRDKVPKMETLYRLIDRLASWKINHLQFYMEHTFAYEGHDAVWKDASPLTGEELLALDAYCQERFIELVPNQNSFGHMHRWLIHEDYNHLAECPEGIEHPFSSKREPYGLCSTDPASIELLDDLYQQLLPHFQSNLFNVGLDETFDIGKGRSAQEAEEVGTDSLYISFLQRVHQLVTRHGKTMQYWADIVLQKPERLEELPDDAIALLWGYEDNHPFAENCSVFADLGLSHYVCPGTSSWNSWAGRTHNTLGNLKNAAESGRDSGALGFLNTDWGDFGHMQPLPVSYLGFLCGAAVSWNRAQAADVYDTNWAALLDLHVFQDRAGVMGQLAMSLGDVYRAAGGPTFNASPLFRLLVLFDRWPPSKLKERGLTVEGIQKARELIASSVQPLLAHQMRCPDAALIADEFRWCADILDVACQLALAWMPSGSDDFSAIPPDTRDELAERLELSIVHHRLNWVQRNRTGGLSDSVKHLQRVVEQLWNHSA